jgi:hypothetical protein
MTSRLVAHPGVPVAVAAHLRARAEKVRDGSPLTAQAEGATRLDQLAAYLLSQKPDWPANAVLALAVRGVKFRPGHLAASVLDQLAAGIRIGDPPEVAETAEKLVAAVALDTVENVAQQAKLEGLRAAQRPVPIETEIQGILTSALESVGGLRNMDTPPTVVDADKLVRAALEERLNAQAQESPVTPHELDSRSMRVFRRPFDAVRRMYSHLPESSIIDLINQRDDPPTGPDPEPEGSPAVEASVPPDRPDRAPDASSWTTVEPHIQRRVRKDGSEAYRVKVAGEVRSGFGSLDAARGVRDEMQATV